MKITTINRWKCLAAVLLLVAGCESTRDGMRRQAEHDAFPVEDNARAYRRSAMAQEAVGARHDGMLYAYHFDGDRLNSLGERKLSMMLRANDRDFPVVVYLNFPADDARIKARQDAVSAYFADAGLTADQLRFEAGPNPNATSPGAQNLARLNKTESESPVASNPTSSNNPGYGTGGGSGIGSGADSVAPTATPGK
jgi:hypothetical protein